MVLFVRQVDTAVVPRVAVAAPLGLQAGEGSLRSIARRMLEEGSWRVSPVPARVEQ